MNDNENAGLPTQEVKETMQCGHDGGWLHHFDPDAILGDYYTCCECGELTQVG